MYAGDVMTVNVNLAGLPALVLPCGFVKNGMSRLPVGFQMIGAVFDEVMNLIGDVKGKIVVMLDDMIDIAGTISKGAALLREEGATEVEALVITSVVTADLWNYCGNFLLHALREVHRRTYAADVLQNPLPASLTDVAFSYAATLLPVTKNSSRKKKISQKCRNSRAESGYVIRFSS